MQYIIPLLFAIGIALIQLVGTNGDARTASTQNSASLAISNASALAQNLQNAYGVVGNFSTVTDSLAISNGQVPTGMANGDTISDGWGGSVTVQPDPNNSAELDEVWTSVPQADCAQFAGGVATALSVSINGSGALTQPIDPSVSATNCTADNNNTITFVFPLQG
jgi:hypothetical protein